MRGPLANTPRAYGSVPAELATVHRYSEADR
jgi:hypothetical protein